MEAIEAITQGTPHKSTLKALRGTITLGAILALITAPVHGGFMLVFTIPFFAVWLVRRLVIIRREPERRKIQLIKIAFWVALVTLIFALHAWYAYSARQYAEGVIAKVEKFVAEHKRCPASSEEIGITRAEMTKNLGYSDYSCKEDGIPHLFYADTFVVFETYGYDFGKKIWKRLD